jgi:hypothetical protein
MNKWMFLVACCLASVGVQALGATPDSVVAVASEPRFSVWGSVLAKGVLRDSSRGNTPDLLPGEFNLGTKVSKGIGSAVAKVWYSPVGSPTATVPKNFWVKQMNTALSFSNGIVFGLGRFDSTVKDLHIDAAKVSWSTQGFPLNSLDVSLFYGNTFEGSANFGAVGKATQWRAYGLAANARNLNWIGEARLGIEPYRLVLAGTDVWAAQNWNYAKLAFGYDVSNLGAKIFGEYETLGVGYKVENGAGTHVTVTGEKNAAVLSQETKMLGVEFWADTRFLNKAFFFAPEDRLSVGGIVEYRVKTLAEASQPTDIKVVAKTGYHTGQLATWFELETHVSSAKNLVNSKRKTLRVSDVLALNMEYIF